MVQTLVIDETFTEIDMIKTVAWAAVRGREGAEEVGSSHWRWLWPWRRSREKAAAGGGSWDPEWGARLI